MWMPRSSQEYTPALQRKHIKKTWDLGNSLFLHLVLSSASRRRWRVERHGAHRGWMFENSFDKVWGFFRVFISPGKNFWLYYKNANSGKISKPQPHIFLSFRSTLLIHFSFGVYLFSSFPKKGEPTEKSTISECE